jgi:plasmid stabilization system protein ParE
VASKLTAYITRAVFDLIDQQSEYYEETKGDTAGKEVRMYILAAMKKAARDPWGYAVPPHCPQHYRRIIAKPFVIFYRINEKKQELTFYPIRGGSQKPLAAATHRRIAAAGEKDRTEL